MHIYYHTDPRVTREGYLAIVGKIHNYTNDDLHTLYNFLSSFLTDCRMISPCIHLTHSFRFNDDPMSVFVSFNHVQTMLNFFDTIGWTYYIRGK